MKDELSWKNFLAPKYWSSWLLIGFLRLLGALPFKAGLLVGSAIGSLLFVLAAKRRKVTQVNVQLCFPELTKSEQKILVKDIFRANGIGFVETAWAYWGNAKIFKDRINYVGFELIEQALAKGRGLILLGGHFSSLDLGGRFYNMKGLSLDCIYRRHNNPLMEYMIRNKRKGFVTPIERKKFRQVMRSLKDNHCVWYAPDQDFGYAGAVFVPFFGQKAATIVATTKLVRLNQSPILMYSHRRNKDDSGYIVEITEVPGFPSGDETQDALIINQTIEREVRKAPEQYMWVQRRFKTQPDGKRKLYKQGRN